MADTPIPWLQIIQSVGIIGGLIFTASSFRREGRAKRAANYLTLTQMHRDIWKLRLTDKNLARIDSKNVDINATELSPVEADFLRFLFLNLSTYHVLLENGQIDRIEEMNLDIKTFLSFPLPWKFWKENKQFYNMKFEHFIDVSCGVRNLPAPSPPATTVAPTPCSRLSPDSVRAAERA